MTANVLALDLGTRCGWALGHLVEVDVDPHVVKLWANPVGSGVWDLAPARQRRFEGAGMKWVRLAGHLDELYRAQPFARVVVEEVRRHLGVDAAHAYGGALATVSSWCERNQVPYSAQPVAAIKKHATGKGSAKKDAMVEAARREWVHIEIEDDNHADALWLLSLEVCR